VRNEPFFDAPITEVISSRTSVRSYKPVPLPVEIIEQLERYAQGLAGPFSCPVRFIFWDDKNMAEQTGGRIGTYGVIKGAQHYIAGLVEQGDKDLEQLGYAFEQLILYATSLGLGTCWLGGTFSKKDLGKIVKPRSSEILPVITPVGYKAEKESLLSKAMKLTSQSRKRKPWEELFFQQRIGNPLEEIEAGSFSAPLEMVRLAPSASNKQPWRIVKSGRFWHFYMDYAYVTNKALGFDIQRIDMGIALCHFELTARELDLPGAWVVHQERPSNPGADKLHYIASWNEALA